MCASSPISTCRRAWKPTTRKRAGPGATACRRKPGCSTARAMRRNWGRFIDESEAPDEQKRVERAKLEALIGYAEAATCRRRILLGYFGDECEPCGNSRYLPGPAGALRRHGGGADGALRHLPHGPAVRAAGISSMCCAGARPSASRGSGTTGCRPSASAGSGACRSGARSCAS